MFRNYIIYLTYFSDRIFINLFRYTGIRYEWIDFIIYIEDDELVSDKLYDRYTKRYKIDNLIRKNKNIYVNIPENHKNQMELTRW